MCPDMLMSMVQYIRWKVKKNMGKATLEYLSMSLARIPNKVVGGSALSRSAGLSELMAVKGARSGLNLLCFMVYSYK